MLEVIKNCTGDTVLLYSHQVDQFRELEKRAWDCAFGSEDPEIEALLDAADEIWDDLLDEERAKGPLKFIELSGHVLSMPVARQCELTGILAAKFLRNRVAQMQGQHSSRTAEWFDIAYGKSAADVGVVAREAAEPLAIPSANVALAIVQNI